MKAKYLLMLLVVLLLSLTACSGGANTKKPVVANPEAGKASVTGRVLSKDGKQPIANTPIRLAEVYRGENATDGAYLLDEAFSPSGLTDENGYFSIPDITAGEYVIVVGDAGGKYTIIMDENNKAKVWNAVADQILDTGDLVVTLK